MNKLNVFKSIAASALVLSAIATPAAFAAPDKGKMAVKSSIGSAVAIESKDKASVLVSTWSDPLSLAKKYAPETAKEWEQVLAEYSKQFGQMEEISLTLNDEGVTADSALSVTIDSIGVKPALATVLPSIALEEIPAAEDLKGELKLVRLTEADDAYLPVDVSLQTNAEAEAAMVTLSATPAKLFQAQVELEEAVQAKADKQIKAALAKLLTTYKEELNK